jgi:hypothetical protein
MKLFRAAVFWWLLAFATGGMFALSCPSCGVHATKPEETITLPRSEWSRVMTVLVTRREERDLATAQRDEARALLRIERNASLSKLAAKDLEIGSLRKQIAAITRSDRCVGWQVAAGVALGVAGACGVFLTVREVGR